MKSKSIMVNASGVRRIVQSIGVYSRTFTVLLAGTLIFFVVLGVLGIVQSKMTTSPVTSMKGLSASVSSRFFTDMIGMELPHFDGDEQSSTFSQKKVTSFLFQFLTNINPQDPKTLLARELPGMSRQNAILLRKGLATDFAVSPEDYTPSIKVFNQDANSNEGSAVQPTNPDEGSAVQPTNLDEGSAVQPTKPTADSTQQPTPTGSAALSTKGSKVILIYHSHNRESWVPELGVKDPADAYSEKTNITLVGKRLADKLNELGVGAVDYHTDYATAVKDFKYIFSYKYSLQTVKEAMATNTDIKFLFDIHRDAGIRKNTTVKINGVDYAQIYFIIGHNNPNWQENEQFATQIHQLLEKEHPGISRGIYGKSSDTGNGEYNQSVSGDSVLIEIGGPFNTLEESYRTADLLAGVIADLYWQAEKVDARAKMAVAAK